MGSVRRIHFIYERATRKFKADLSLWLAWLDFCKRSKSNKQFSKVCDARLSGSPCSSALVLDGRRAHDVLLRMQLLSAGGDQGAAPP